MVVSMAWSRETLRIHSGQISPALRKQRSLCGGDRPRGRWTQYMIGFRKLYVVDYYSALLEEIGKNVKAPNIELIKNNGTDFPGIDDRSIDYIFSFGIFVHLDGYLIQAYLANMKRILKSRR